MSPSALCSPLGARHIFRCIRKRSSWCSPRPAQRLTMFSRGRRYMSTSSAKAPPSQPSTGLVWRDLVSSTVSFVTPQDRLKHNIHHRSPSSMTTAVGSLPEVSFDAEPLPPHSPVAWAPPVRHAYAFDTDFSRDPARVREVYDAHVQKTKELNEGKPQESSAKRRAQSLGLAVSIGKAKSLHWRSIQARPPVLLTAGPASPQKTPRYVNTDYPSAES